MIEMKSDGNCLFRVLAYQVEGDQEKHGKYRQQVVTYMYENEDWLKEIMVDDKAKDKYCKQMEKDGEWGDQIELTAIAYLYGVNILVHRMDTDN